MNRIGRMVQKHVRRRDTVLDIGCGLMQSTMDTWWAYDDGRLRCRSVLGLDGFRPYLEKVKNIPGVTVIEGDATDLSMFLDKSFDVCLSLDVIEHLEEAAAEKLAAEMERIARRKVIIFTPSHFTDNRDSVEHPVYGENELQEHKCLVPPEWFVSRGFRVELAESSRAAFAVKTLAYTPPEKESYGLAGTLNRKRPVRWVGERLLRTPVGRWMSRCIHRTDGTTER